MSNHDHTQVVPKKARKLSAFYGEVLKKTTDSLRALSGKKALRIWEDRVTVAMQATLETAIERLVYIFCNPAAAGLSDSIGTYTGISSWNAFCTCEASVDAKVEINAPWHRVADLPEIGLEGLTKAEDERYAGQLCSSKNSVPHTLVFEPFAWLGCFNVTDPKEIEAIRKEIIAKVKAREAEFRKQREKENRPPMTPEAALRQPLLKPHTPKKKERKVFLFCHDPDARVKWIKFHLRVDERCNKCYARAKKGHRCKWPPGTFTPWLPPVVCNRCTVAQLGD
jgi:hypothetical protein